MIISHKLKFIFIKTGKTGGTSIETYLSQFCGFEDVVTPFGKSEPGHIPRNYNGFYSHMPGFQISKKLPNAIWESYYKFTVERNPWDKAISHYFFLLNRFNQKMTFDEYLSSAGACLNYPKYTAKEDPNKVIVNRVIQYEKLNEELEEAFTFLKIPFNGRLEIKAKSDYRSDRRSYRDFLNSEQSELISEIYSQEIRLHNYQY